MLEGREAAARIRAAQAYADLTIEQLSARSGIAEPRLRRLRRNDLPLRPGELELIARICGLPEALLTNTWR